MALFPSVIPWTLVLTQVMTAGLAVVPGRWAHLFRKCLQVQVLCGWEREQRTQRSRLPLPVGSGSLEEEEEKKNPFALFKKSWGRKRERSQDQGPQYSSFRRALSHAHINIQRQDLHGRVEQVISNPGDAIQPTQWLLHRWPWTSSPSHKKEKTHNTNLITLFSWKRL